MRALVIVHEAAGEAMLVGTRLEHHGYEQVEFLVTPDPGSPFGSMVGIGEPTDYDLIVAMGSVHSLTAPDDISSWIHDELDLLRRADDAGVPVLGVCFGSQALAVAHGGRVVKADRPQIGWHPLEVSPSVAPLAGPWMQWHYDRFEPPSGADVLAADEIGVQAFRLRRNLAVQFHPEVTRDHVARWVDGGGSAELEALAIDPDQLLVTTAAMETDAARRTDDLVDWFLAEIASS